MVSHRLPRCFRIACRNGIADDPVLSERLAPGAGILEITCQAPEVGIDPLIKELPNEAGQHPIRKRRCDCDAEFTSKRNP